MSVKKYNPFETTKRQENEFGSTVDWKRVGQQVSGVYTIKKEGEGKNKSNIYRIDNIDGQWAVWGTHQLDEAFEKLTPPCIVCVRYMGLVRTKGSNKNCHTFQVWAGPLPPDFDPREDMWDGSDNPKEVADQSGAPTEAKHVVP
ncbi:MAG: hypothetical protein V3U19_03700 [Thermodesulfobacteriota bacterium]